MWGVRLCEKFTKQIVLIKNLFWENLFNVTAAVADLTHSLRDNILSQWENELKSIHTHIHLSITFTYSREKS